MPNPVMSFQSRVHGSLSRWSLLVSVSALALVATSPATMARPLGNNSPSPSAAAIAAAQSGQLEAQRAARDAQNALKRAGLAIQAQQATQKAARDAARAVQSAVPNGLVVGGLQVAPGAIPGSELWQGAKLPTGFTDGGRSKVTVEQTQQKAILNWQTFNVGKDTDLYFNQTAGGANAREWIALNRVLDPSASPSKILGSITAEGQVYVINRNGIVFGGASQVNVGTLIASSLRLTNEQFLAGINNPQKIVDQADSHWGLPQFGEYTTQVGAGTYYTPSYIPGDVTVEAGAQLKTAAGGKLMLFGPKVTNAGELSARDGQVILAAGEQVWIGTDTTGVRGLNVAVSAPAPRLFNLGQVGGALGLGTVFGSFPIEVRNNILPFMEARAAAVGYRVTNSGSIHSEHGNVTLQSRDVIQGGVITATSGLESSEGSIRLRAWGQGMMGYSSSMEGPALISWSAGTLTLGSDSVTSVTPDLTDATLLEQSVVAARYKPGWVELRGKTIGVQSRANVIVPSGTISAVGSAVPVALLYSPAGGPYLEPVQGEPGYNDGSRIYIDSGAYLSTAGLQDMLIAMERNFVEAEFRINELRDTPLYKDSWLRGRKVIVDRRVSGEFEGGPMSGVEWIAGDPGAWKGTPLGDLTAWIGLGKTDLAELSTKAGQIVLKSSGSVITRAGSLLDVSGGSVRYSDGWNNTTRLLGANGRIYDIGDAMPDQLYVAVADGFTRHNARWGITETWSSPLGKTARRFERGYTEGRDAGSIRIYGAEAMVLDGSYWGGVIVGQRQAAIGNLPKAGTLEIGGSGDADRGWTPSNLIITGTPATLPNSFAVNSSVGTDYYQAGRKTVWLGSETLNESGLGKFDLFVTKSFSLEKGTKLELDPGANFSVAANGPANGAITYNIDGTIRTAGGSVSFGTAGSGLGSLSLGANAVIDVSGVWQNDLIDGPSAVAPTIRGGTISILAGRTTAALGAVLDVSGGGWASLRNRRARLDAGDGGSITLGFVDGTSMENVDLRGFAAGSGGSIRFETSASVQLGGATPSDASILHIPGSLYAERGFRSFAVLSQGSITVPDGAVIDQLPYGVLPNSDFVGAPTGSRITDIGIVDVLPARLRTERLPTSIALETSSADITIGVGSHVRSDVGGRIQINANKSGGTGSAIVRGTLEAPAGSIVLESGNTTRIESGGRLLARGAAVIFPGSRGLRQGEVLSGGSVTLSAGGLVALDTGSLIDVSGVSGVIDSPRGAPITVASDGGMITLNSGARVGATVSGSLLARAGGAGASGGALSIIEKLIDLRNVRVTLPSALYYLHPTTGAVTRASLTTTFDFDIRDEYGTAPLRITNAGATALTTTPTLVSEGMSIVDGPASQIDPAGRPLWEVNPQIDRRIVELLNKHFWNGTGSGTAAALTTRIVIPSQVTSATRISDDSLASGGFANVSLSAANGLSIGNGVNVNLSGSLNIGAPRIANAVNGGNARLAATYLSLTGMGTTIPAQVAGASGRLTLSGSVVDVNRSNYIRGFAETVIEASDLRLSAPLQETALLDVQGAVVLKSGQTYPATGVKATVKATTSITVERNGDPTAPLSAGGSLTLDAPVVDQNGVLRAPFGEIVLKAGTRLTLGAGSLTSVSGAGLIVPYGLLANGEHWVDPTKPQNFTDPSANYLSSPPQKRIAMESPIVNAASGSVVDISGGGDLYAREFVPGPGGSHDILATATSYAVIPGFAGIAPSGAVGSQVWLGGGNGLAAGWYTLLPASYASLPGAYLVTPTASGLTTPLTRSVTLADGSVLMGGRRGNELMRIEDQLSSTWRVMDGSQLRQYSEYNEALANTFFASDAFKLTQYRLTGQDIVTPRLPMDGGAVVFKAAQQLVLNGSLKSQPAAGGRGGLVDIAGTKIAIVGAGQSTAGLSGYLLLDAGSLSGFGASSLLIGGTRTGDPLGLKLTITASDIVVQNDNASALMGPEIILAASGLVDVRAGSVILAAGDIVGGAGDLIMTPIGASDYGALVRVSNGDAVRVIRQNVNTGVGGIVTIGAGARLAGGRSLLIDATRNTELAGTALLSGASLSVASGRIGFGGGSEGLVLSLDTLAQLSNAEALTLRSYSSIDFRTSIDFGGAGLASVTLDAAGLAGYGASDIVITGAQMRLENSGGGTAVAGDGSGALRFAADDLVLGRGTKSITGFDAVVLAAGKQIVGEGNGSLDAGTANLTLVTPVLTGRGGSAQAIETQGALVLTEAGATSRPLPDLQSSLGTRLSLSGSTVNLAGHIAALGGAVDVTATAGNVVVGVGTVIDVGGFAKQFFDVEEYGDAGRIALAAVGGDVLVNAGATLNLAAHARGGNAGTLAASSDGGTVALAGTVAAQASRNGKGGSFILDSSMLDYATMNDRLNASGFTRSRQFRVRTGDVVISGSTSAEDFQLSADTGKVTIAGAIDARSSYGGRIAVTGGNGLVVETSASLLAGATDTEFGSGRVTLEASGGRLAVNGGTIDVSGGQGGKVRFRALQTAGHDEIAVDAVSATILGSRSTVLEGVSVYGSTTTSAVKALAIADANTFAANSGTIATRLGFGGRNIALMSGIEIRSSGDLTVDGDWNLLADFASQREGTLTLRAAGNLIVNGNISDGFDSADRTGVLQDAASWNLRLVGGADLAAADALATAPLSDLPAGSGTIKVGDSTAGKLIRTGTGDIQLRASRDIDLAHFQSVIYTAGRNDTMTWDDFTAPAGATYGIEGGHLSLGAGGNISTTLPANKADYQLFNEWLRRRVVFNADQVTYATGQQATWWIDHGRFQQGVGALGGGNVSVDAGGDLVNLLVALPSNARVRGGRTAGEQKVLEMRNGGLMSVEAGGAIRAGQYYAGRGAGVITAGELVIGRSVTVTTTASATQVSVAPVLAVGDASLAVQTAGAMRIQTLFDPLLMNPWRPGPAATTYYGKSSYTDRTSLALKSIGGNIQIVNAGNYLFGDMSLISSGPTPPDASLSIFSAAASNQYPALTRVVALNGGLEILGPIWMQPGARTQMDLLVENDIILDSNNNISMSRWKPAMNNSPLWPTPVETSSVLHLLDDYEPHRLYARSGSIVSGARVVSSTNKQTWIRAGHDIRGIAFEFRNIHNTDVTILEAGNDIISGIGTYGSSIGIDGPGSIVLSAGRDVYGGAISQSLSIVARENDLSLPSHTRGLPAESASISVIAGLNGQQPGYDAFAAKYLDPANVGSMPAYLKQTLSDGTVAPIYLTDYTETTDGQTKVIRRGLTSFITEMTGETLSPLAAWDRFQTLSPLVKQAFLRRVYMQELRDAGRDQLTPGANGRPQNGGYNRGYAAISALFPGDDWAGDVKGHSLTLKTLFGGNIEVLTPGGGLQVAALGASVAEGAGLVTQAGGRIDVFARDSIAVNRSRILSFAAPGTNFSSDMIIWATLGDIDAGRGAKTVRTPKAPIIATDLDGNTTVSERLDLSGSGLGTVGDGDLDLIAPKGTVNAGDAGIRAARDLNIAALHVVNADNIQVGGKSKGVPVIEAPNIGGLTEASNAAGAAAQQAATPKSGAAEQPSVIIVEVLGFGGGDGATPSEEEERRPRMRGQQQGYNVNSVLQLVGIGAVTEAQKQALTPREIKSLDDR